MTTEDQSQSRPEIVPINNETQAAADRRRDRDELEALQTAIGNFWAQEYADQFCYDHGNGRWMVWDGVRWAIDEARYSLNRMSNFIEFQRARNAAFNKAANVGFARGALEIASVSRHMARRTADFDADPYVLGTPEGYIDLITGEHHEPDRSKYITHQTALAPAKSDACPKWIDFLTEAHEGQEDAIDWLQKVAGEALLGRSTSAHFVFFHGTGGNGKSVFTGVLLRILDEYATVAQSGTFTMPAGKSGYRGHMQVLARLRGKRLVIASEPDEGEQWDMGRVKEWTGGNKIAANFMRQDSIEFLPQALLIMEANVKLPVATIDNSVARRLRFLVWPHTFDGPGNEHKVDRNLLERLIDEEGPQILAWMIRGAQRVIEEGLGSCGTVRDSSADYLKEQDVIARFISDCLAFNPDVVPGVFLGDVTAVYNEWARHNEQPPRKYIGGKLRDKGISVTKSSSLSYVRQMELTAEGREHMSAILARRLRDRDLSKSDARRWDDILRTWKLTGEDGDALSDLLSNPSSD